MHIAKGGRYTGVDDKLQHLRHATSPARSDDDFVDGCKHKQFCFVSETFRISAQNLSGPTAFRFSSARIASSTPHPHGTSSPGLHGDHFLSSPTVHGSRVDHLALSNF